MNKPTIDDRARHYYQSLTRPLAGEQGLVETAYTIGAMDQYHLDRRRIAELSAKLIEMSKLVDEFKKELDKFKNEQLNP